MLSKLAYLGPRGTFCEEAARKYTGEEARELLPRPTIEAVFSAVHLGEAENGIVPIENSCEGAVNQTLDLLAYEYDLKISGEIILAVKQNLLARPGVKLEEISRILSHPQALAQCRRYLSDNFQQVEFIDVSSTAEAARQVANSPQPWAAIGNVGAAQEYGLEIVEMDIQDGISNETRFIIISREYNSATANTKTSLLLFLLNKPGALFKALEQFYSYDINLTKIESRPARTVIGDYMFFIDIEGHSEEPRVIKALQGLAPLVREIKLLGSYPLMAP